MKKLLLVTAFLFIAHLIFAEFYYVTFYTQGAVTSKTKKFDLPKAVTDNMEGAFFEWKGNSVTITVKVDDKKLDKVKKEIEKDGHTIIAVKELTPVPTPTITATVTK